MNIEFKSISQKELDAKLIEFCHVGDLDKVRYLLTSPELTIHANVHALGDTPFYKAMNNKNYEIIEYFIFELNIQKDSSIKSYLNIFSKKEEELVDKMFQARDLAISLNQKSTVGSKTIKI